MAEHDFYTQVLTALGELKAEQSATRVELAGVKEHLGRLNGKVADHERRLGEMLIEVAERRNQCPLVDSVEGRLRPVEEFITTTKAQEKANDHWLSRLWPFIWAGAGAIAMLLLSHADQILPHKP